MSGGCRYFERRVLSDELASGKIRDVGGGGWLNRVGNEKNEIMEIPALSKILFRVYVATPTLPLAVSLPFVSSKLFRRTRRPPKNLIDEPNLQPALLCAACRCSFFPRSFAFGSPRQDCPRESRTVFPEAMARRTATGCGIETGDSRPRVYESRKVWDGASGWCGGFVHREWRTIYTYWRIDVSVYSSVCRGKWKVSFSSSTTAASPEGKDVFRFLFIFPPLSGRCAVRHVIT